MGVEPTTFLISVAADSSAVLFLLQIITFRDHLFLFSRDY